MSETGHPPTLPDLFLDRSLGRRQVPARLREHGLRLLTLSEVYGIPADQDVADVTWLEDAGRSGWVVLMKDERVRYREVEKSALLRHRVRAFCLANGNLRAETMADLYLRNIDEIGEICRQPGPFLYVISAGKIRSVDLS